MMYLLQFELGHQILVEGPPGVDVEEQYREFLSDLQWDWGNPFVERPEFAPERVKYMIAVSNWYGVEGYAEPEAIFIHRLITELGFRRVECREQKCLRS